MRIARKVRIGRQDGQAMVEMALILPILLMIILGIVQFGIAFNNYITLTDATRAGARKASVARFTGDNGTAAAAVVKSNASSLNQSDLTVTVTATNWSIPGSDVTVTATYPYSINLLGWTVNSGTLTSTTKERLE
ncbi:MAG TPA: TadE/TadG family type IV pilus assembly protein [Gaiellaceae bacterium]